MNTDIYIIEYQLDGEPNRSLSVPALCAVQMPGTGRAATPASLLFLNLVDFH